MTSNPVIDHVHYRCADLEAAVSFYQRVFDAELVARTQYGNRTIVTLRLGGIQLCFSPAPPEGGLQAEPNQRRLGVYHLAFQVPDLAAAVAECKRRGAQFVVEEYRASPTRKVAFIEAPDGMQVELMQDYPG